MAVWLSSNEAPKHNLARLQVTAPLLFISFPCESDDGARQLRGLPLSQLTDPRLDKVTMAPLRLRLYTCDTI